MSLFLNMWNYRDWFRARQIPLVFSIRNTESRIAGVRFYSRHTSPNGSFALLSDAPADSVYRSVLSYGDDRIFFRDLSPFDVMNEISRMSSVLQTWEKNLQSINLAHGSLSSILEESDILLDCPVVIQSGDQLLAVSHMYRKESEQYWNHFHSISLSDMMQLIPENASFHELSASEEPVLLHSPFHKGKQCVLSNIVSQSGRCVRIIAFANQYAFSPGELLLMRHLTKAVRINLDLSEKHYAGLRVNRNAFFNSCIARNEEPDIGLAMQVLRRLGWKRHEKYMIIQVSRRSQHNSIIMDKLYQTLRDIPSVVCIQSPRAVFLVCNVSSCSSEKITELLRHKIPSGMFVALQSNLSADFLTLPQLFRQADHSLKHAEQTGADFVSFQEIMTDYTLHKLQTDAPVQKSVHPAVLLLKETDLRQKTAYAQSLYTLLHLGCNYNSAAKTLGIHRNTLISRLRRITALTGLDLSDPKEQEALMLSFLISEKPKDTPC